MHSMNPAETRTAANEVLDMVLNGETSWSFAFGWLNRAVTDTALHAEIKTYWETF